MDVVSTAINAAVVAAVGLILAWLGRGRFEEHDRRMEQLEQRLDHRMDGWEQRMDHRMGGLEQRMGGFQASLDALRSDLTQSLDTMRSDLTQVALAIGVKRRATNA
jgi:hypothetical protein